MAVDAAVVSLPCASTVNVPTLEALPYAPAVTAVFAKAMFLSAASVPPPVSPVPAVMVVAVRALADRSALRLVTAPSVMAIVVLTAVDNRPYASTVNTGTAEALP